MILANESNKRNLPPVEVYDLVEDPGEQENIAGQNAEREATLKRTITDMQAFIREKAAEPSLLDGGSLSDVEEQLDALGYLAE